MVGNPWSNTRNTNNDTDWNLKNFSKWKMEWDKNIFFKWTNLVSHNLIIDQKLDKNFGIGEIGRRVSLKNPPLPRDRDSPPPLLCVRPIHLFPQVLWYWCKQRTKQKFGFWKQNPFNRHQNYAWVSPPPFDKVVEELN